jgi:hypothetical protein
MALLGLDFYLCGDPDNRVPQFFNDSVLDTVKDESVMVF